MILGYKCFNKDLTNQYGFKFEVGKTYHIEGKIEFGPSGNGFHFCTNLEDCFRYYDTFQKEICLCEVKGSGQICKRDDEYNGYYDMYSAETISLIKVLTREQIINIGLNLNEIRIIRFIQGYKLTKEEIELFKEKFSSYNQVLKAISYYQEGNINAYNIKKLCKEKKK